MSIIFRVLMSLSLFLAIQSSVLAQTPSIHFEYFGEPPPTFVTDSPVDYYSSFYKRRLKKTKAEVIQIYSAESAFKYTEKQVNSQYQLLIFDYWWDYKTEAEAMNEPRTFPIGIYILQNQLVIGYCIIDSVVMPEHFQSDPIIQQIKKLKSNKTYLKNELTYPKNAHLEIFEQVKDGYVERYGLYKHQQNWGMVLQAFYPVALDADLKPYLVKTLNNNLNLFD